MQLPSAPRRRREISALLEFGAASAHPYGFGYLDDDATLLTDRGIPLWITCRMTHCFALASMLPAGYLPHSAGGRGAAGGSGGSAPGRSSTALDFAALAEHGVRALQTHFKDAEFGGFYALLDPASGEPTNARKEGYGHAFVVLAASSAVAAGVPGARDLLADALITSTERWWDEDAGMVYESYNRDFSEREDYRGVNAAMHTTESYLAAAGVTGDDEYLHRAVRMVERVVGQLAPAHGGYLPEHLDANYQPMLDFNVDAPADPFRPYGATPGHWFEWGRLALQMVAECEARGLDVNADIARQARAFIARGTELFGCDGADGWVYTVDFAGQPVVRERMHWVACEAFAAGVAADPQLAAQAWSVIERYFIDRPGQWFHELDAANRPAPTVWPGKPDIYHAVQALLFPDVPLAPAFACAVSTIDPKV